MHTTPVEDPERLIGSTEALDILGIDRSTLSRWVAAGKLTPAARLGDAVNAALVFHVGDVRALAAQRAADAASGAA